MSVNATAERLSTIIEQIYGCGTEPALWPAMFERINEATECSHAVLGLVSFPEHRHLPLRPSRTDA